MSFGFRTWGFRLLGFGLRIWGLGFRAQGFSGTYKLNVLTELCLLRSGAGVRSGASKLGGSRGHSWSHIMSGI